MSLCNEIMYCTTVYGETMVLAASPCIYTAFCKPQGPEGEECTQAGAMVEESIPVGRTTIQLGQVH